MNPKFSIIIPVYNVAPYLRECLDSVLAQTFTDWEAICVDDGSTDGSGVILDEYAARDSRFRVIHQPNRGVSAARNAALDIAKGEWIEFIDADDSIEPEALSRFMLMPDKSDVIFFGCIKMLQNGFQKGYVLPNWPTTPIAESSAERIALLAFNEIGDVFGWTWDKFIRRAVIEQHHIRFDQSISYFEDEVFTLEVMNVAQTFATVSDCFYRYRETADGLTAHGALDLCELAESFLRVGAKLKNSGLRKIAYLRALDWLRQNAGTSSRIRCARLIISLYRVALDVVGVEGNYNKMLSVLSRLPDRTATFLLAIFHLIHK